MILEILTPGNKIFSDEVHGVQLPGIHGQFEVLNRHAPLVSALGKGILNIFVDKNCTENYSISGGFVEVLQNKVIVLVEQAKKI